MPLTGMSLVLRVLGAPKLAPVARTLPISTTAAARLGQADHGGFFSIPWLWVPQQLINQHGLLLATWYHPTSSLVPCLAQIPPASLPGWCENK